MAYGSGLMDVVQSSTAGTPPQFNDGNGVQTGTLCRAWVNFNGVSGSVAIRASFNVSSITYNGTGDYTINFTNAFSDTNYSWTGIAATTGSASNYNFPSIGCRNGPINTSNIRIASTYQQQTSANDFPYIYFQAFR